MSSRRCSPPRYDSIELGMRDLKDPNHPLTAFAVDTLASAVIYNTLGGDTIRPSGTISDPIIYGFVLNEQLARRPARLLQTPVNMSLVSCMDTLIRSGPIHYSRLIYFRGLDTYLQFSVNEDLRDQEIQKQVGYDAMVQASFAMPITVVGVLFAAYIADLFWRRHKNSAI